MMLDARASQTSYISQVLLIGVENCIVRFDCRRNRLWYTPLANQKTPQAPHCIGDPSRMMAKKLPALLQLLGRQKGEAARSPATEISLDCCASKDVTLASEKPVSLLDHPVIEIIQNATQQWERSVDGVRLRNELGKHQRLL